MNAIVTKLISYCHVKLIMHGCLKFHAHAHNHHGKQALYSAAVLETSAGLNSLCL